MTSLNDVRVTSMSLPTGSGRGLIRWVCTNNPFYVLSAGLFLAGLWISFGTQSDEVQTWGLMSGLAAYTLLLAVTACLLVRFGKVWDDVRTVLLLVVLMFLATSVTFDEVLVFNPSRGFACYLGGLLFAVVVSEGVLRGIRLALPAWFRVPYYLILALFFLYPLPLRPLLADPRSEALMWGLFGFSPVAGLIFLSLLPAIRRGPDYMRDNGSPWRWPLYPWVLFGLLACVVPARAFLLCWSMQMLETGDLGHVMFGPFFAVPFGLALALLLLEIGLISQRRAVLGTALALPGLLTLLLVIAQRDDPIYRGFLAVFTTRVGEPLLVTLLASACFYAYAMSRGIPRAAEILTAVFAALAVVGPDTLDRRELVSAQFAPLLAAAALQLGLGIWHRHSWPCLMSTILMALAALAMPAEADLAPLQGLLVFHLALFGVLLIGAALDDILAHFLRVAGSALLLLACLGTLLGRFEDSATPLWAIFFYPLFMAALLVGYSRLTRQRFSLGAAGLVLTVWLAGAGWHGYCWLRQVVMGLDHILLSLALFGVALLISLGKSGMLARWIGSRRRTLPATTGPQETGATPIGHDHY